MDTETRGDPWQRFVVGRIEDLDTYMDYPWKPQTKRTPDGEWELLVPPLEDFQIFGGSEAQVLNEWKTALQGHLEAYIKVGKLIPRPL